MLNFQLSPYNSALSPHFALLLRLQPKQKIGSVIHDLFLISPLQTSTTRRKPTSSIISCGPRCNHQPPDLHQRHSLSTSTTRSSRTARCKLWLAFCKWCFVCNFKLQVTQNMQTYLHPLLPFLPSGVTITWNKLNLRKSFQAAFLQSYRLK